MRVLLQPPPSVGDPDQAQQLGRAPVGGFAVHAAVLLQGFGDLSPDGQDRVQRGHRLLEHHADVAAPHLAHFLLGELHQVAPGEQYLAFGDPPGRVGNEAHHR